MRYPKLRELREAVRALVKGPYTSGFPRQPHKPFERFRGKPEFNSQYCIGCTACVQVCPAGALEFKDSVYAGKAKRILTIYWDRCIACGQCQANCPPLKGIVLSQEFDLATTEKREELTQTIEKELMLCECCSEVVAPADQVLWVAKRLGPLTFTNTSLILFYLEGLTLGFREKQRGEKQQEFLRSDRFKIVCPRCRREAVLKS